MKIKAHVKTFDVSHADLGGMYAHLQLTDYDGQSIELVFDTYLFDQFVSQINRMIGMRKSNKIKVIE